MVDQTLTERVKDLSTKLRVSIAETPDEFSQVAALRYSCYRREGVIDENPEEKLTDRFDGAHGHPTFLVSDDTGLIASIRCSLIRGSTDDSPSMISYFDEIKKLTIEGVVVDPNRFVIDRQASLRHTVLHYFVLTIPFAIATVANAAYALASVRPEHRSFYARTLRYREIAPPRNYLGLKSELILMCAKFRSEQEREAVILGYPFFGLRYAHTDLIERHFSSTSGSS